MGKSGLQVEKRLENKVDSQNEIQKNYTPVKIEKKIYNSLNLLKILAIFLVILVHIGLGFRKVFLFNFFGCVISSYDLKYYFNTIIEICVPIFFMVNGALLFNSKYDHKKHIKKCIKLLIMITVFSFLTLLVCLPLMHFSFKKFLIAIFAFEFPYNNHLWFLRQLFIIYVLFPFLKQVFDNYKKYFIVVVGLSLFFIFTEKIRRGWIFEPYNFLIKRFSFTLVYFTLGGVVEYFFRKKTFTTKWRLIITISLLLLIPVIMLSSYLYGKHLGKTALEIGGDWITQIALTIAVYSLFRINDTGKTYRFVNWMANQTMFVYVFQYALINYYWKYFRFLDFGPILGVIPSIVILLILTVLGWFVTKNKCIKFCFKL